jgi:hypothetical protein
MVAGYSGTPLAKKLGLKPGDRIWRGGMPESVAREIDDEVPDILLADEHAAGIDAAHLFTRSRAELAQRLVVLRTRIKPDGMIWVSWPKKASGVATDITEGVVREIALPLGLVDTKVCAVDSTWSGLKLVIRRELRG